MKFIIKYLIYKPTLISVFAIIYFVNILFGYIYGFIKPPSSGSSYYMILETQLMFGIIPLILMIIDRVLVKK